MTAITVFCSLSVLLVLGKFLRMKIQLLQRLYLPSSVIGGVLGLVIVQCLGRHAPPEIVASAQRVPGFLINVIFAALFLGTTTPRFRQVWQMALPQLCMGQLLSWGQYVIGLGLAGFFLAKAFGVPVAMGNLVEIGFEGGHGTVGGMVESFKHFQWEDGVALGYTMATVGMILGILLGMALINWALRKGHVTSVRYFRDRPPLEQIGVYEPGRCPSAGHQTVICDSLDSLAWHISLIGLAILLGFGMLQALQHGEVAFFPNAKQRFFSGFPLFPLCMIGGVILQKLAEKAKMAQLIDHGQMQRLSGASLDFLVVSAVSTIKLSVVLANWLPLLILVVAGTLWSVFMVVWLAPRLYPDSWFERSIAEFGQSLGVTATGLMLLRTVDPENRTPAAASFGYKQLIHEPFMGGGLWTALALPLVFSMGWFPVWLFCTAMLILWGLVTWRVAARLRRPPSPQ
ncbi:MAG: hypothetical protein IJJ33_20250 [Victivallales bacterium]|nr:hypothetical protein [Victivallales bacterium]